MGSVCRVAGWRVMGGVGPSHLWDGDPQRSGSLYVPARFAERAFAWLAEKSWPRLSVLLARQTTETKKEKRGQLFPRIALAIGVLTSNRGGGVSAHLGGLDVPCDIARCQVQTLADWTPRLQSGRLQSGRPCQAPPFWSTLVIASSYCSCFTLLSAVLFLATLNRRGGWLATLAGFTLRAIAGCIAWVPLLGALLGCQCWVPLLGAIARCHCRCAMQWVALLGAIAGVPLLGAIVGAMAGCHCWVRLPDASYQI